MRVSSPTLSTRATEKERECQKNFFKLLILEQDNLAGRKNLSTVEKTLILDCVDELNCRYADFSFLVAFAASYSLRNRTATTLLRRYRLPLYIGLVGYECGLRSTSLAPAMNFWNATCVLDSPLGTSVRWLSCPSTFFEVKGDESPEHYTSYLAWLGSVTRLVGSSILLEKTLARVFDGTCWKTHYNDAEVSSLVVNSRFFKWTVFSLQKTQTLSEVKYNLLFTTPNLFSTNLVRSSMCQKFILENSTLAGRVWYGTHFALLRLGLGG